VRYARLPARGTVEAASRSENMALLLPLIVLAAFLLLRNPQRRRAQTQKALLDSLQPGARVATVAGVIGTLVGTEGDRAAIEIAPGVIVEFLLAAITRTIEDPPPPLDGAAGDLDGPIDGPLDEHGDGPLDGPHSARDEHGDGPLDGHAPDDHGDHAAGLTSDGGHDGGQINHDSGDALGDDVGDALGDDEAHRAAGQPAPRHEES